MKIFLAMLLISFIILGFFYYILDKNSSKQTKNEESFFLTILSAFVGAFVIILLTIIPSIILFIICLGIENLFPHLLKSKNLYDILFLSILSIGITFIFEIFFKGFFTGFSKYFKLPQVINIIGSIFIYTITFYLITEKFIKDLHLTMIGSLIISIIMVLIDLILDKYVKNKKHFRGLNV
ncbi:hypothetical protein [Bacillus sp. XF8]|uniref:hypothetical protein n=1 Tax=Bacillus sp. XF8 TaxID=2819289 RepID=UPI001AA07CC7|nr:hypothetical protein [Bacillus sp. XF8]MBO1580162.1 hypothetical protein [Bacillus sp. XF8]